MRASNVPADRYWSASTSLDVSSEYILKIKGAAATATTVITASTMTPTEMTADVPSSSSSSCNLVNNGTRVAESTPPSSNS